MTFLMNNDVLFPPLLLITFCYKCKAGNTMTNLFPIPHDLITCTGNRSKYAQNIMNRVQSWLTMTV